MKFLEKIKENLNPITLFLLLIIFFRQCGINRDVDKINKSIKTISARVDSIPNSSEFKKELQISRLQLSKSILYDWNSVVRTAVRPDDRMNQYDQEIEKLQKSK